MTKCDRKLLDICTKNAGNISENMLEIQHKQNANQVCLPLFTKR